MTTRDDNIVAEEARAIEVGEETGAGAPGASGGSGRGRRDTWATHTGFILACVGSAVGMANIWLFPYRVAQLGGAAFLIPYLIFVALLGFTGVIGEMSFGRAMGAGPMGAFGRAMEMRGVRHGEKHNIAGSKRRVVMRREHEIAHARKRGVHACQRLAGIGVRRDYLELEIWMRQEQADELDPGIAGRPYNSCSVSHMRRPPSTHRARRSRGAHPIRNALKG